MRVLNQYPLVRILFPFIGGILIGAFLKILIFPLFIVLGILFITLLSWLLWQKKHRQYKWRWISGFLLSLLFIVSGLLNTWLNSPKQIKNHYSAFSESRSFLIKINSPFTETNKTFKSTGRVKAVLTNKDSIWQNTQGKILLYFEKQENFDLNYGDELILSSEFSPLQNAENPHAFDYALFMQRKGIYDQCFIKEKEWKKVGEQDSFSIQKLAIELRTRLLSILEDLEFEKESTALAAALLIGYDEYLDDDIRARFSGSGAMHILCVSGLHVGILFMLCNFIFGFLDKTRYGSQTKTILILLIIWLYALITGLAPSVLRASTMFSFMIIGKLINRKGNTYNSLAASAFILLFIDPNLIYNIGFQLSYSAVVAILYIQPKLYSLFYIKNFILDKIWALITVSIAAQLGTFPLAIYYFHQFPNYFLLTNIWVIPLAFIVVIGGLFVLLIGGLGLAQTSIGSIAVRILHYSLLGLDNGVKIIDELPYSTSTNLVFNEIQLICIYLLIFSFITFVLYRKRLWFIPILLSLLILISNSIFLKIDNYNSSTWILYKTKGLTALDFISENRSVLLADSIFIADKQVQKYVLKENHLKNHIRNCVSVDLSNSLAIESNALKKDDQLILFQSLKMLYLDKPIKSKYKNTLPLDYIIIAKNAKINLKQLIDSYNFKTIIFDSSNSWWYLNDQKLAAEALGLSYWDVNEQGAFVWKNKKPAKILQRVFNRESV